MSLAEFQRAMADLAASPAFCGAVMEDPTGALSNYTLSTRESARIASVVHQPGMAVHCTIHRTTRLVPLDTLLPLTCAALGCAFGREIDAYWAIARRPAIRFETEAARFVEFLERRLSDGSITWPWPATTLADLARLELAIETLRIAPRNPTGVPPSADLGEYRLNPAARVVVLNHDAGALLTRARGNPLDLASVPRGACLVVITSESGRLDVFAVPPGRVDDVEALVQLGLAAEWLTEVGLAVVI